MVSRTQLLTSIDEILAPNLVKDYCPNGLQVEGREEVQKVILGVTASKALIEAAVEADADAVLVHHGIFWKGDDPRCVGVLKARLAPLLQHDINLFAYHLPLDIHESVGNNAQLAARLNWQVQSTLMVGGIPDLLWCGEAPGIDTVQGLADQLSAYLGREALVLGEPRMHLGNIAWCTGAAHRYLLEAKAAGATAFVTGEVSEPTFHLARELGVACIAAGHHATERYGVQALGERLAKLHNVSLEFVDIENPI
jgi:dinuclear metal center YbgI/SA1388 family protein